jgi:predicted PurR-regulated permease PerM
MDRMSTAGNDEGGTAASILRRPIEDADVAWRRAGQVSTIGIFVIALTWVMYAAQHVVIPVLLAWTIATIVLPIVKGLERIYVPRLIAAIAVTAFLLFLLSLLILLLSAPIVYWLGRATEIAALLREKLVSFTQPLALLEELRTGLNVIGAGESRPLKVEAQSTSMVATLVAVVTPAISQFLLFIGSLLFYLVYQKKVRSTLVYVMPDRDARLTMLRTLNDIDEHMTKYFGRFTIVNVCLGLVTAALTWTVGLPNPLLWGVLAAVLNYVPYLGPAAVTATLFVVGLLVYPTLGEAVIAPLAFLAIVTLEGQFLTPVLMARKLELNPFAVFLAIAFCTWMWGPLGAFLAVPVLICLSLSMSHAFNEDVPDNALRSAV